MSCDFLKCFNNWIVTLRRFQVTFEINFEIHFNVAQLQKEVKVVFEAQR